MESPNLDNGRLENVDYSDEYTSWTGVLLLIKESVNHYTITDKDDNLILEFEISRYMKSMNKVME